jgi:DNA helicase-2/ATP-dependent DNA helicase PcrA
LSDSVKHALPTSPAPSAPALGGLAARARAASAAPYLAGLNPEQREAVETLDGPVLVLAGAGTGKTRVLTTRIVHILSLGRARPSEILAVTFTNKAAREMKLRIGQMVGEVVEGMPWLGTFHAIGVKILRRHAEMVGLKTNFTILDVDDQIRLLKQLLEAENIDEKRWPARILAGLIDGWKNRGLSPKQVKPGEAAVFANSLGIKLYAAYQERLKTLNAVDFGDLLLENIRLFREQPETLRQYQHRFKFILVDEYQDTNTAQYLWLRLLGQSTVAPPGREPGSSVHLGKAIMHGTYHPPLKAEGRSREAPWGEAAPGWGVGGTPSEAVQVHPTPDHSAPHREDAMGAPPSWSDPPPSGEGASNVGAGLKPAPTRSPDSSGEDLPDTAVSVRSAPRVPKNICCVGDDDQSIYGWRGADVDNILRFETDFPGAKVIRLERNYRSTGHILAAASQLIARNEGRLGKTLRTESEAGEKVTVTSTWDSEEEARVIGEEIEALQRRGHSLDEIAILVRASFQMREFEDRFVTLGLSYRVIGGPRFYERAEIRDALAYLRCVNSEADDLAFERIINVPKRGLGDATVKLIHDAARRREVAMMTAAREMAATDELKPKPRQALRDLLASFDRWRVQREAMPHTELAEIVLDESGYTEMWQKDRSADAAGRLENLKELVRSMHEFENLQGFLEHISLVMDIDKNADAEAVSVMTLHSAKGLEFDTVFLPGWEEGLLPHQRSLDEQGRAGLEEERRLAHVGLTRARRRAKIYFVSNRRMRGSWAATLPSRFVDELPEPHVEVEESKGSFGGFAGYGNVGGSRFDRMEAFGSSYTTPGWQRARGNRGGGGGTGSGSGGSRGGVREASSGASSNAPWGGSSATGRSTGSSTGSWGGGKGGGGGTGATRGHGPITIEGELVARSTGTSSAFAAGDRVFHQKFGNGNVVHVEGNKLTIAFDRAGEKKVVDSFVERV